MFPTGWFSLQTSGVWLRSSFSTIARCFSAAFLTNSEGFVKVCDSRRLSSDQHGFSVSSHTASIFYPLLHSGSGWVCWSLSQLSLGADGATPCTDGEVKLKDTQHLALTYTHTYDQFRVPSAPRVHVLGLWEKPQRHKEHANSGFEPTTFCNATEIKLPY